MTDEDAARTRPARLATIYDVARAAGVSHQTVSRLLSGFEGIRPSTRARIEAALADLDYRPNTAARALRTQRSNRIGVVADRVDQTGPARIIAGALERARERGYLLDVVVTHGLGPEQIRDAIAQVHDHRVVGVIATAQTDSIVEHLRRHVTDVPFVVDARFTAFPGGPSMNEFSGWLAADHLLDLGHTRIGYLSGPLPWLSATGRRAGFIERVAARGGHVAWTHPGDWTAESGTAAWRALSPAERDVTAIAAGNDSMAIGLISAAAADGVRVPEDLSVVGNDDIHEARFLQPALSTVAVAFESEGRLLVDQLLAEADPARPPVPRPERPHLEARASTRALHG